MHYLAWLIFIVLCASEICSQIVLDIVKRHNPYAELECNKLTKIVWILDVVYLTYYYFGM